jgi:hypothetical protein
MSEGDIPETDGYKELEDIIGSLIKDIAHNTLDYTTTGWGNAIKH